MNSYTSLWSTDFGRYLIASNDIPSRSSIFIENALLAAPADEVEDRVAGKTLMCLGCCRSCPTKQTERKCNSCHWYICSEDCEKSKWHAENECLLFTKNKVLFPPPHTWPILNKTIFVLRCLLTKTGDPQIWTNFIRKLEHHTEIRKKKPGCYKGDDMIIENVHYFYKNCECPFTDEEIRIVCGVINVNAFCAARTDEAANESRRAKCLFVEASLLAHSCSPNCSWNIRINDSEINNTGESSTRESFNIQIEVFAAVPIKKGEMFTIFYSTRYALYGTLKRIVLMEEIAHFVCKCARCSDKTELGTCMSAVKCIDCDKNFLLPEHPTTIDSRWKCLNPVCNSTASVNKIVYNISRIEDHVESIKGVNLSPIEEVNELQKAFQKYSGKVVHRNHYLLQEISTRILQILMDSNENILNEDKGAEIHLPQVEIFATHCQYLSEIAHLLLSAMTGYIDILKTYMQVVERIKKKNI